MRVAATGRQCHIYIVDSCLLIKLNGGLQRLHTADNDTVDLLTSYHSVNSSLHSVNGDIAIQWEWSKFDPSQNPNPLTAYDKTLHN